MSRTELGITGIILNNTDHLWMKQGDFESASLAANDLLGVTFNPRSIKEIYQRTVRLGDQDFIETKLNYFTPQEQHALFVKWLMRLEVGEAFAKVGSVVRKIRITPVESRISNEEVKQWRVNQPWLIGVKEEISISISTEFIPTPLSRPSQQASTPIRGAAGGRKHESQLPLLTSSRRTLEAAL